MNALLSMQPHVFKDMAEADRDSWYYLGKRAVIRNMLRRHIVSPLRRVVDVGCGTGGNACVIEGLLEETGEYIGIEPHAMSFSPPPDMRTRLIQKKIEDVSLDDVGGSAQLGLMIDVLEHMDEDMGLERITSLLDDHGFLLVTVPAYMCLWGPNDEAVHHRKRYTLPVLRVALEDHGFSIVAWNHYFAFAFLPVWLLRHWPQGSFGPVWLNGILRPIVKFEAWLGSKIHLPFGIGIVCLAKKD